ncbi:4Fe-4S dicluster domain-containing protein [Massilia sp. Root335]|uniref:4Fe-4S dicluster domain-containing protein n=1 Tax=Massilia sp. Root335 TaxID=1736517 RepID=UPI0006FE54B2|nr:4Fe-4S dicluster domain-containing protein [Massilia sp. Root335]KQV43244.1 molybdopterin oxidoreductase [Massilia sp. Root335]
MTKHDHPIIPIAQDEPSRRRFLKLMAASAALAGAGCSGPPAEPIVPYVTMPEQGVPGLPMFYATAFVRHGLAHGVLVESNMGRPTKVEGNPDHPVSAGTTDVFAQASILQLWDPDRSQAVFRGDELATWGAFEAALQARRPRFERDGGAGLRILTGTVTSPTLANQLAALQKRLPNARWHAWDPLHDDGAAQAAQLAFGRPLDASYRLDGADVVLALDADLFGTMPGSLAHARAFTAPRRLGAQAGANRLYVLEATPTLTGAYADARLARPPHEIEAALWRIAARLGAAPDVGGAADPALERWEAAVAKALDGARGRALVVAGPAVSPAGRALAYVLTRRLNGGADGPLAFIEPVERSPLDHGESIAALAGDMRAGRVDTLLMLDANPAYDAPADLDFSALLARVPLSAHLGLYRDETARAAGWHLSMAHCYEAWSDARAHDGTASIVQPLIAPLYGGRSAHEILALLAGADTRDGHALVRASWPDGDAAWRDSLRRGIVDGSAAVPVAPPAARAVVPPAAATAAPLVALFAPDPAVDGGAFANNAWLQELPRPLTSLTWDNAALIGPATAARLHLADGMVARLRVAGRAIEVPVLVVAGQAEGVVTLPLGYGRRAAGGVGEGVGFDAYRLRTRAALAAPPVLTVETTGRTHDLVFRQREVDMHGRAPVHVRELARGAPRERENEEHGSMYPKRDYDEYKWGMAIDLNACIGCASCTIACQAENNIPVVGKEEVARGRSMHWIRVDRYQAGARTLFQPVPCMHCEHAPCEEVCPVGATMHDSEGLNVQVYNRCIGTRFCSNNCPYKVRRFNFLQYSNQNVESLKALQNPEVTVRRRGVMEKCSYCLQRITRARIEAEKAGRRIRDGEMVTACQAVCPTRAIRFGDLNDPASDVVAAKASDLGYDLLEELNTRPRTSYLTRVLNPDPELE